MGHALGTTTWQSYNFTVTPKRQKSHMPLVGFKVATDHNHDLSGVAIYSVYMLLQPKSIKVGSVVFLVKFFDASPTSSTQRIRHRHFPAIQWQLATT